jgi:hypothetical protein
MMPPIGMLAPLFDVLLVMGTEVVTVLGAEMVLRAALIVVVAIVPGPFLIFWPATIISGPVLRHSRACENQQSRSQHESMQILI